MARNKNIVNKVLGLISTYWKAFLLIPFVFLFLRFFKPKKFVGLSSDGATISDDESKRIATVLYSAMGSFGTDTEVIFNALKGITKANFSKVYNSFGLRYYNPIFGVDSDVLFGDKRDLWHWLNSELSFSEMEKLKQIAPLIFV